MHITRIAVTYGRRLQLRPRDEAHIEVTLEAHADPTDQIAEPEEIRAVAAALWEQVRAEVRRRGDKLRPGRQQVGEAKA